MAQSGARIITRHRRLSSVPRVRPWCTSRTFLSGTRRIASRRRLLKSSVAIDHASLAEARTQLNLTTRNTSCKFLLGSAVGSFLDHSRSRPSPSAGWIGAARGASASQRRRQRPGAAVHTRCRASEAGNTRIRGGLAVAELNACLALIAAANGGKVVRAGNTHASLAGYSYGRSRKRPVGACGELAAGATRPPRRVARQLGCGCPRGRHAGGRWRPAWWRLPVGKRAACAADEADFVRGSRPNTDAWAGWAAPTEKGKLRSVFACATAGKNLESVQLYSHFYSELISICNDLLYDRAPFLLMKYEQWVSIP